MNIFKPLNQRGVVPPVVILSIIGLIGFLILTNTFEFKDKLYSKLYPKTHTEASEKIDSLTNQLLSFAQTSQPQTTSDQDLAKERKQLLLELIKNNPQTFLEKAVLVTKEDFSPQVKQYLEKKVDTQGEFIVTHIDGFDNNKSIYGYFLQTKDQRYQLYFSNPPEGILSGSEVKISSIGLDNQVAFSSSATPSFEVIVPTALAPVVGERKIAVLLVNFTTQPTEQPITKEQVRTYLFGTTGTSLDTYYRETSFNKIFFTGDVYGYFTIDPSVPGFGNCKLSGWEKAADDIATASGVNLTGVNHKVYIFPPEAARLCGGFIALGDIGSRPSRVYIADLSSDLKSHYHRLSTYIHEIGHNLGVWHASFLNCYPKAIDKYSNCRITNYGDTSSVMGAIMGVNFIPEAPPFEEDQTAQHHAPHKLVYGWIPESNVKVATSSGQYQIYKSETLGSDIQIIKIPKVDTNENYYLSYRQPIGFDSVLSSGMTRGISIHVWNHNFPSIDTKIINTGNDNPVFTFNAALADNATFFDEINNIKVKQLNHNNDSATISIELPQVTYNLVSGLNSFGFPFNNPITPTQLLDLTLNKCLGLIGIDPQTQRILTYGFEENGLRNNLTAVNPGSGYIIYCNDTVTFNFTGVDSFNYPKLYPGSQLITVPLSKNNILAEAFLQEVVTKEPTLSCPMVAKYDQTTGGFNTYHYIGTTENNFNLGPFEGYLVWCEGR